jgi:hypothetical protein
VLKPVRSQRQSAPEFFRIKKNGKSIDTIFSKRMQGLQRLISQTEKNKFTPVEQGHVNIQVDIKKDVPMLFIDFVELFRHVLNLVFLSVKKSI